MVDYSKSSRYDSVVDLNKANSIRPRYLDVDTNILR